MALWLFAFGGFWGTLLLSCLAASQVPISVDGALTRVNGLGFAGEACSGKAEHLTLPYLADICLQAQVKIGIGADLGR
jgi:hypothetical protein